LGTLSFDPWGRRRNPTNWSYINVPATFLFNRGYTRHEHLVEFDLMNMNGLVNNPALARFLSLDSFIQNPGNPQCCNRYSYCLNNLLNYTYPSGYQMLASSQKMS
jgi:RHS repeat-associated protein